MVDVMVKARTSIHLETNTLVNYFYIKPIGYIIIYLC